MMNTQELNTFLASMETEQILHEEMMELLFKHIKSDILALDARIFLTGSNFWCNGTSDSDHDICVPEVYRKDIKNMIKQQHLTYNHAIYNNGLYVNVGNEVINIIFLGNDDLKPWKLATELMTILIREFGCIRTNKVLRYGVFESLRAIIKMLKSTYNES